MMHASRVLSTLLLTVVASACNRDANSATKSNFPDGRDPVSLERAFDAATVARLERRTGTWESGDSKATFEAYVVDSKVRLINESMQLGKDGVAELQMYYTVDGKVSVIREQRTETVQHTDRWPTPTNVVFSVEVRGDSTATAKTVDGTPKAVQDFEITGARNHALEVLALADKAPAARKP